MVVNINANPGELVKVKCPHCGGSEKHLRIGIMCVWDEIDQWVRFRCCDGGARIKVRVGR